MKPRSARLDPEARLQKIREKETARSKTKYIARNDKIERVWGEDGKNFKKLLSNGGTRLSHGQTQYLSSLSSFFPDWTEARMFINKAVYERSVACRKGSRYSLTPGTTDLIRARDQAKTAKEDPNCGLPTISKSELDDLAKKRGVDSIGYGYLGLLQHNPQENRENSTLASPSVSSTSHTSYPSSSKATSSEQNSHALRDARPKWEEPAESPAGPVSAPDNETTDPPTSTCACYQIFTEISIAKLTALRPFSRSMRNDEDDAIQFFASNTNAFHDAADNGVQMCPKHMKQLADSVNMHVNIGSRRLMRRFARVSLNAQNREKWSNENVKSASGAYYFRHGQDPLYSPLRYPVLEHDFEPKLDKSIMPFVLADILKRISDIHPSTLKNQRHHQPIDIPAIFDWWFDGCMDNPLIELAQLEIDVYNHHLSSKSCHKEMALMPYFGYGLFQQLFDSDPVVYVIQQCMRNLNWGDCDPIDLKLLALPQPILFAQGAVRTPYRLTELSGMLCTYLPLSSETTDVCAHYLTGVGSEDAHAELLRQYHSLVPKDLRQSSRYYEMFMTLEQRHIGEITKDENPFTEKAAPCASGALRLWRSHIPVALHVSSDSQSVRKGLLSILVSADDNTGYSFVSLRDLRSRLTPIDYMDGNVHFSSQYPQLPLVQHLNVPTALSRAILGQDLWGSLALREASLLLGPDRESAWDYIQRWRQMAACMIRSQFEYMKATERELYKENSFFEQHKDGVATSGPSPFKVLGLKSPELSPSVLSDDSEVHDDASPESDVSMEEGSDSWSETSSRDDSNDVEIEGNDEASEASRESSIKEENSEVVHFDRLFCGFLLRNNKLIVGSSSK